MFAAATVFTTGRTATHQEPAPAALASQYEIRC